MFVHLRSETADTWSCIAEYWVDISRPPYAALGQIAGAYEGTRAGNWTAAQLSALQAHYCSAANTTYFFQYNNTGGPGSYFIWTIRPPQLIWQVNYFIPNMYANESVALQDQGTYYANNLTSGWTNASYVPNGFNLTDIGQSYYLAGPSTGSEFSNSAPPWSCRCVPG